MSLSKVYKFIFILIFILINHNYNLLFSGNQEILIFSLICIILSSIYNITYDTTKNYIKEILIIFFSINLLIWTKQEGVFYSFILLMTFFLISGKLVKEKILYIFLLLSLFLIKILIFKIYNLEISLNSSVIQNLTLEDALSKITVNRILINLQYFFYAPFQNLFIFFGILIYLISKFLKIKIPYIDFYIFINLMFIFAVYLLVDHQEFFLKTGIDRLLFHVSPIIYIIWLELTNYKNRYHSL